MVEPIRTYTNDEIIKEMVENSIKIISFDHGYDVQVPKAYEAGYLRGMLVALMDRYPEVLKDAVDALDFQHQEMERKGIR